MTNDNLKKLEALTADTLDALDRAEARLKDHDAVQALTSTPFYVAAKGGHSRVIGRILAGDAFCDKPGSWCWAMSNTREKVLMSRASAEDFIRQAGDAFGDLEIITERDYLVAMVNLHKSVANTYAEMLGGAA